MSCRQVRSLTARQASTLAGPALGSWVGWRMRGADPLPFTSRAGQMDPEDVRALLSPFYVRLRSELERFGGTVEKFIGDAAMALFGAPVTHEDDPERAVRAALAIRDWVREEERIQVRLAVNRGGGARHAGTPTGRG